MSLHKKHLGEGEPYNKRTTIPGLGLSRTKLADIQGQIVKRGDPNIPEERWGRKRRDK